jgi:pimeloyl-ACP methyl ester carboxylesterase
MAQVPDIQVPDILWLNVSPALSRFNHHLLHALSQQVVIAKWDYTQTLDEPNSFDAALTLLHGCLQRRDRPVHLVGHSTSGLLGLLYARLHPQRVKSLTLLSVGVFPAIDWQAHYYAQAQFLRCSRSILLTQMAYNLFGCKSRSQTQALVSILDQDLLTSLSPHTLVKRVSIAPSGVDVPLMVCGGADDIVIDPNLLQGWQSWLKPSDRLWICPNGEHFFHNDYPNLVCHRLHEFWASVPDFREGLPSSLSSHLKTSGVHQERV